ncbi:hypothetical protein, partial [Falsirhodobacter sp. alg1]|uniref:hypothetical protein n=1 Tax=Falsirhodobacter sp. alg1 TaxID=1472418 RepID=UPI0005EF2080
DGLRRIDDSVADPGREISARTLADPALIEGARARFAEFCDPALPPNALFDAKIGHSAREIKFYGQVFLV